MTRAQVEKAAAPWGRRELAGAAFAVLLMAALLARAETTVTFEDSAGRRIAVPARVERVFAAGPPASVLVFAIAPDTLLGWNRAMTPEEARFIPPRYAALPALGRLTGRANTANVETVLKARPDLILDVGSVTPTFVSLADRVQAQTGVPYVLLDGRLEALSRTLELAGALLGRDDRAQRLAQYVGRTLEEVRTQVSMIAEKQRPRVYYARGPNGLQTALPGSINVEALEFVGARNVAAGPPGGGLINVSREQVLAWNPEVIVTIDPNFYAAVWSDPAWAGVAAVRSGRVHLSPHLPFGWVDFPPGLNRVMGVRWLAAVLYPDRFPGDLRRQTEAFYRLFYHRSPEPALLDALLAPQRPLR